jgi:hypothetical protein
MLLALPVLLSLGCVTTDSFVHPPGKPGNEICQLVVTWNPEVVHTPDPAHAGSPTPGIAGRLYFFGPQIDCPRLGDGSLVVDLFDETGPAAQKKELPLEEWRIDRDTLKRLAKRDAVGWGYTLFLPWGTYRRDITHVQLRLRYDPVKGNPLYAQPAQVVLNKANNIGTPVMHHTVQPSAENSAAMSHR